MVTVYRSRQEAGIIVTVSIITTRFRLLLQSLALSGFRIVAGLNKYR